MNITVYVSIGNSDDKLTQAEWSAFYGQVVSAVRACAQQVYGEWQSAPVSQWQNACIGFAVPSLDAPFLKDGLRQLAAQFGQDSIAWAEAQTEFLSAVADGGA